MPTERLKPNDPRCLSPKLLHVDMGGHFAEDDPRRVEAREQHKRWSKETADLAPSSGEALDHLEARMLRGEVLVIRQFAPGRYLFVRNDGVVFDLARGRFA